jgi:beta-lactamase class D
MPAMLALAQASSPLLAQASSPLLAQASSPLLAQASSPLFAQASSPMPAQALPLLADASLRLFADASLRLFAEASLRATAMAIATALVLAVFRVRDARVRHAVWSGMLVVMLLSPLAIAWGPKARVPVRAAEPIVRAVGLDALARQLPPVQLPTSARPAAARAGALANDWRVMTWALYVAVALVFGARIAHGIYRVRRLLRGAIPHGEYLIHPACAVPVVVGWYRPRIVLPVDCHEWAADRLAMVLAHEQAHARRRDSIVRLLSLANRAVFWFHPLAWWLHRELAALAEEACDATAAAAAPSRSAYADCLIAIARHARRAKQRVERVEQVEPVAIGMASTALRRRVRAMLAEPPPSLAPHKIACVRVLGALLLLACVTATPVPTMGAFHRTPGASGAPGAAGDDPFRGFAGTFVVRDDRGLVDVSYNAERADLRFSPCSTFKLPFAVMFLENGIVRDPAAVVKYEPRLAAGLMSGPPGTAHDQTLTSAFHESANWYFDTVSRSLDRAVVRQFTTRAGYGNADVRDAAEQGSYWYDGRLRISANEQVRFLQRLHKGELGVSARTTGLIKQVAQAEETPRWRLAGKTGACRGVGEEATTHWYVGWVEKADNTYYFALQFAADDFDPALRERVPIAKDLLARLHILD